ncbi:MAG: hypothetical protein PWR31_1537, partial [Bacillota bacterium]|nr:hypothetical protein [Bacillota bacterium]
MGKHKALPAVQPGRAQRGLCRPGSGNSGPFSVWGAAVVESDTPRERFRDGADKIIPGWLLEQGGVVAAPSELLKKVRNGWQGTRTLPFWALVQ